MPDLANDRAADNWATLLAIADQACGEWRQKTEDAISALTDGNEEDEEDDNVGLLLLADLRRMFTETGDSRIASQALVDWLAKVEERPWATYSKQDKPITTTQVARLLKPFGIRSKKMRINAAVTAKGYERSRCLDSFLRYLPPEPGSESEQGEQASNDATKGDFSRVNTEANVHPPKTGFAASNKVCSPVHSGNPQEEGEEEEFSFDPDTEQPFDPDDAIPF